MGADMEHRRKPATSHCKQGPGRDWEGQTNPLPLFTQWETQRAALAKITCGRRLRSETYKLGIGVGERLQKGVGDQREAGEEKKKIHQSVYLIIVCARQVLECCSICLEAMVSERLQVFKKKKKIHPRKVPEAFYCALRSDLDAQRAQGKNLAHALPLGGF